MGWNHQLEKQCLKIRAFQKKTPQTTPKKKNIMIYYDKNI